MVQTEKKKQIKQINGQGRKTAQNKDFPTGTSRKEQ